LDRLNHRRKLERAPEKWGLMLFVTAMLLSVVAVSSTQLHAEGGTMTLTLRSDAFNNGEEIPSRYTCEGEDIAPALTWDGVPADARSLVLIVDDPDAPDPRAPKMTWVHWVLYNIPPDSTGLAEGAGNGELPAGTEEGLNDWRHTAYGGPCPPIGRHRYFFKLYALNQVLHFLHSPTKKEVETAMRGAIVEETVLLGTYQKLK